MVARNDSPTWGWLVRTTLWFGQTLVATIALYVFWGAAVGDGGADFAMAASIPFASVALLFRQVDGLLEDKLHSGGEGTAPNPERAGRRSGGPNP